MNACQHIGEWDFCKSALMPNFVSVRCVDCGIETSFAMAMFEAGLVTGNLVRESWGQPKDFVPPIPETAEKLLAKIGGGQS